MKKRFSWLWITKTRLLLRWLCILAQFEFSFANAWCLAPFQVIVQYESNFRHWVGDTSLTHYFSVISENIIRNHILLKTRFFVLLFCCRQCVSNFNHCDVIAPPKWIPWNNVKWWPLRHSRSSVFVPMESPYTTFYVWTTPCFRKKHPLI